MPRRLSEKELKQLGLNKEQAAAVVEVQSKPAPKARRYLVLLTDDQLDICLLTLPSGIEFWRYGAAKSAGSTWVTKGGKK